MLICLSSSPHHKETRVFLNDHTPTFTFSFSLRKKVTWRIKMATGRKLVSFSQIASTILASVSENVENNASLGLLSSSSASAGGFRLKGKLDLSLWRDIGDDDDEEDDEEVERVISPQAPILAPLLATKKKPVINTNVDGDRKTLYYADTNSLSVTAVELTRALSPLPGAGSSHLLRSECVQKGSQQSNLLTSSSPPLQNDAQSELSLRKDNSRVGESGGDKAVLRQHEEQEKPQGKVEKLPSIILHSSQTSTTTKTTTTAAVLLSSFIGSYQLSSDSQFPSGREREKVSGKKVGFAESDLIMEEDGSATVKPHSASEKEKRSGSGKDGSTTRSRSGSAVRRPSSRTHGADILQEIRKMSLASQDAQEQKKKAGEEEASSVVVKKFGKKKLQKKRKAEEIFTDKDRAAAVTLGSKDIKQSLKAKKKRDRKMRLSISFVSGEEYVIGTLLGEATYQMKVKNQPEAALQTLNQALEIQPSHKAALVARSQCYLKLGDAESALKDAQQAWDPNNPNETYTQGLYQYAEALYQLGEFEKALIAFHRGHRSRKDMDGFRIGIQKCQEAIRRAIGEKAATSIPNFDDTVLPLIQELNDAKSRLTPEEKKKVDYDSENTLLKNIAKQKLGNSFQLSSPAETKVKSKLITRELMGQLCLDKLYLKKFINRPEVINQEGKAKGLRDDACQALKYLESRERFWRQQNPLYSRKNFSTMLKAHAHDAAVRDKPVTEDPSIAKYLLRRRSSAYISAEELSLLPEYLQMRRRSSEPQLDKSKSGIGLLTGESSKNTKAKSLRKTPSTDSNKSKSVKTNRS